MMKLTFENRGVLLSKAYMIVMKNLMFLRKCINRVIVEGQRNSEESFDRKILR